MTIYEPDDRLLLFLSGDGTDHNGRTYDDMLAWTDTQIEQAHDSIQWMFPLHEVSGHFDGAPVVTEDDIEDALGDPSILQNLEASTKRMEQFFAIGEWDNQMLQGLWCRNRNHNLLRVTRIIRCLRLFGLDDIAKRFYDEVVYAAKRHGVSDTTLVFWRRAMEDDIWKSLKG